MDSPLWIRWVALAAAAGLGGYLLAVALRVGPRTARHRRRHRELLDLVGRPLPALPGGRLLDSPPLGEALATVALAGIADYGRPAHPAAPRPPLRAHPSLDGIRLLPAGWHLRLVRRRG